MKAKCCPCLGVKLAQYEVTSGDFGLVGLEHLVRADTKPSALYSNDEPASVRECGLSTSIRRPPITPSERKNLLHIVGRPGGRRVRAWFATEKEAAKRRIAVTRRWGKETLRLCTKHSGKLTAIVDLPTPLTVVEAAVVKTTGDMTGDELLKLVETMGSPIRTPRELLHLRKENARLQKENTMEIAKEFTRWRRSKITPH
jgi:hypothetical protein